MVKKEKTTIPKDYTEEYTTYELTTKTTFHKPFVMPVTSMGKPKKKARESKPPTRSGKRTKQRYD